MTLQLTDEMTRRRLLTDWSHSVTVTNKYKRQSTNQSQARMHTRVCDWASKHWRHTTGVNPAVDAGDTSPPIFWLGGDVNGNIPPILLRTFGYSRPILVALRSLSHKPISFGYKTPPIRFSQTGGQSAHKARPPNLELALTPLRHTINQSINLGLLNSWQPQPLDTAYTV